MAVNELTGAPTTEPASMAVNVTSLAGMVNVLVGLVSPSDQWTKDAPLKVGGAMIRLSELVIAFETRGTGPPPPFRLIFTPGRLEITVTACSSIGRLKLAVVE